MTNRKQQDKILALAGVFQAANLVDTLSTTGHASEKGFTESISSIFQTDPASVSDVYDAEHQAQLGVSALEAALSHSHNIAASRQLAYTKSLIRIERVISRHHQLHTHIKTRIDHYKRHFEFFESVASHGIISKLGKLYIDTAGVSKYRVIIRGRPSMLMSASQKEKLCAVLFAGIRSAHLWRELGGSEWELTYRKRYILNAAEILTASNEHA
ncbi:MAG: DUF489 family protein [Gammaproteobacteria bacterium]|nr:DUF489 family protein [Gammaproteobacteria bacterium]